MAESIKKPIYIVVTPFFPSPSRWQGAFVLEQVKAIKRTGLYKVVVFKSCAIGRQEPSYQYDGIDVNFVPSFFTPSYLFNGFLGGLNGHNLIKRLKRMGFLLDDIAVVHVHTASYVCFATALKSANCNIKTVLQYHDPDPYQIRLGKWANWRPNALYRAKKLISQFKYIDLHLCISQKVEYNLTHFPQSHPQECCDSYVNALNVVKSLKTLSKLNTYILYNGVDTFQFHAIPGLKDSSVFKIGCVANFVDWKDQITLIRAIEILVQDGHFENIRVSFVGSGVTKQYCQNYINKHELAKYFIFEKEVHHSKLVNYYNSLDLFVLPSFFEGFGCVFTEAAACGVPFMGCKNQGYSEYIADEDKDKWLIEPHDYEQLARLIMNYIQMRPQQNYQHTWGIDILFNDYLQQL